jgi:hypothetical protein
MLNVEGLFIQLIEPVLAESKRGNGRILEQLVAIFIGGRPKPYRWLRRLAR